MRIEYKRRIAVPNTVAWVVEVVPRETDCVCFSAVSSVHCGGAPHVSTRKMTCPNVDKMTLLTCESRKCDYFWSNICLNFSICGDVSCCCEDKYV